MKTLLYRKHGERGQSIVEFALIFMVLILLTLGFLDLGRAVYMQSVLANAAREGARAAIINVNPRPTDADIRAAVRARAIGIQLTDGDITISPSPQRMAGQQVSVTVTTNYAAIFLPYQTNLVSTASMTVE